MSEEIGCYIYTTYGKITKRVRYSSLNSLPSLMGCVNTLFMYKVGVQRRPTDFQLILIIVTYIHYYTHSESHEGRVYNIYNSSFSKLPHPEHPICCPDFHYWCQREQFEDRER